MGASGSAEQPVRRGGNVRNAGSGERLGQRIRRVRVTGAGASVANGIYNPMPDFAGGEAFFLEVNHGGINKIYIRRLSDDEQGTWVITLSPHSDTNGDHLYKRICERALWFGEDEQLTPPLFGWAPCTTDDGAAGRLATQLVQGVPKLKYHYGPMQDINWDCQPPGPGQLDRRPPRQTGISSSLVVCVINCVNVPETRAHEFHVTCQVPGKNEIVKSEPVPASRAPDFMLKTPLQSWNHPDGLEFTMYAERGIKIGVATLDYEYFRESGFVGDVPVRLFGSDSQEVSMSVCVTMPGQPTPGIDAQIRMEHGSKIGIDIAPDSQTNTLTIIKIFEGGLIARWNDENPEQQIGIRDKIIEIDGESGSCRALLKRFASDRPRTIRLRVLRPGT